MTRKEKADALHGSGFNCAQSVLAACSDLIGMKENNALAIAGGFGGGFRCGEVCGAVSGAVMALGTANPFEESVDREAKDKIALLTKSCTRAFRKEYGTLICRELLAKTAPERHCPEYIRFAVGIVEDILINNGSKENETI